MKLTADWICGFVDNFGEGNFVISITKIKSSNSEQVRLYFKVTQHYKNVKVLYALKNYFGVGIVKRQTKDPEKIWEYVVSRFEHLNTRIIPFFESNKLHTTKQFEFLKFRKVAIIMARKEHLTADGLTKIKLIAKRMNKLVSNCVQKNGSTNLLKTMKKHFCKIQEWDEDKVRTSLKEEEETEDNTLKQI
jgi:hypothetical protein